MVSDLLEAVCDERLWQSASGTCVERDTEIKGSSKRFAVNKEAANKTLAKKNVLHGRISIFGHREGVIAQLFPQLKTQHDGSVDGSYLQRNRLAGPTVRVGASMVCRHARLRCVTAGVL